MSCCEVLHASASVTATSCDYVRTKLNKKGLVRERKRHTAAGDICKYVDVYWVYLRGVYRLVPVTFFFI